MKALLSHRFQQQTTPNYSPLLMLFHEFTPFILFSMRPMLEFTLLLEFITLRQLPNPQQPALLNLKLPVAPQLLLPLLNVLLVDKKQLVARQAYLQVTQRQYNFH